MHYLVRLYDDQTLVAELKAFSFQEAEKLQDLYAPRGYDVNILMDCLGYMNQEGYGLQ